jgi:hypothetical protein
MAEFSTFWAGFLFFLMCCVVTIIMAFYGGNFIDIMHNQQQILPGHDSDFATAAEGQVYWWINLYYAIMYMIPILGAVVWGQSIIKRVRESQYTWR